METAKSSSPRFVFFLFSIQLYSYLSDSFSCACWILSCHKKGISLLWDIQSLSNLSLKVHYVGLGKKLKSGGEILH